MVPSIKALQQKYFQQSRERGTPPDSAGYNGAAQIQSTEAEITDSVNISRAARAFEAEENKTAGTEEENLSEDQRRQVEKLKQRDQEVKAHERAHMAAGGGLVQGGASYAYQRGADGKLYAMGGEVKIDTSSERDPGQTIRKMEQVKRAALAPAQPSGTDRAVAARASQIQLQAQMEKAQQRDDEPENGSEDDTVDSNLKQDDGSTPSASIQGSEDESSRDVSHRKSDNLSNPFNLYEAVQKNSQPSGRQISLSV